MLIYNFQKEFLGVDEKDLNLFGFSSLKELQTEVTDFADFFVKTPGYIHNFQHIHWIDFIQYSDDTQEAKVIINVHSKTFSANLKIAPLFLIDSPEEPGFIVHFYNLRTLSNSELEKISVEALTKEHSIIEPQEPKTLSTKNIVDDVPQSSQVTTSYEETITPVSYKEPSPTVENLDTEVKESSPQAQTVAYDEKPLDIAFDDEYDFIQEADATPSLEIETKTETIQAEPLKEEFTLTDIDLDVFEEENNSIQNESKAASVQQEKQTQGQQELTAQPSYYYDPHIASQELGLPIDLIEEFIQDFILQAREFKEEIYRAIEEDDIDKVKTLSHKLKGVAANLRVEDAHEVLSTVSASSEMSIIHEKINAFYNIIAQLSGEKTLQEEPLQKEALIEIQNEEPAPTPETPTPETDLLQTEYEMELSNEGLMSDQDPLDTLELSFKDDEEKSETEIQVQESELSIDDSDVPEKIDIPELADDTFFDIEDEIQPKKESMQILYSKEDAAKEIGIDIESFNELFEDFTNESVSIYKNIQEALEADNLEMCRNEVAKLKAMSENMRFNEFSDELETLLYSSDKESMLQASKRIHSIIEQISKMGA